MPAARWVPPPRPAPAVPSPTGTQGWATATLSDREHVIGVSPRKPSKGTERRGSPSGGRCAEGARARGKGPSRGGGGGGGGLGGRSEQVGELQLEIRG